MRFPAKITSSYIWVAINLLIELCYIGNLWYGRTVGRSVGVRLRDYQIFSDG